LTQRYKPEYFGRGAVRIGVALFGNGKLITAPDGSTSVAPALNIQELTDDFDLVQRKIAALKWLRGFTNMAQGLTMADVMLSQGGRSKAQSAVMVLSDGKYSFKFQTAEKAQELKDKNVQVFMAPISEFKNKELDDLKTWASSPWETNFEWIPGLKPLKYNPEIFIQKLVAKFCPDSFSPSQSEGEEKLKQYIMVHEGGWPSETCAKRKLRLRSGASPDDCAAKARTDGKRAFGVGSAPQTQGMCFVLELPVTQEYFKKAEENRADVQCPGGVWEDNGMFDSYIINPQTAPE